MEKVSEKGVKVSHIIIALERNKSLFSQPQIRLAGGVIVTGRVDSRPKMATVVGPNNVVRPPQLGEQIQSPLPAEVIELSTMNKIS